MALQVMPCSAPSSAKASVDHGRGCTEVLVDLDPDDAAGNELLDGLRLVTAATPKQAEIDRQALPGTQHAPGVEQASLIDRHEGVAHAAADHRGDARAQGM